VWVCELPGRPLAPSLAARPAARQGAAAGSSAAAVAAGAPAHGHHAPPARSPQASRVGGRVARPVPARHQRLPLISRDEEAALAQRIRDGDQEALDKLVRSNLRFVVSVAKKYQNQGVSLSDLINEGNLGLIRRAHKFDETKGIKFISYASGGSARPSSRRWPSRAASCACRSTGRDAAPHRQARNTLLQELGREATHAEIAEGMDITEEEVAKTMSISQGPPLARRADDARRGQQALDYLADEVSLPPDEQTYEKALTDAVEESLASLKDREAKILRPLLRARRLGADDARADRRAARHHARARAPDQGEGAVAAAARLARGRSRASWVDRTGGRRVSDRGRVQRPPIHGP
jgi:RNA polymerase primary sigma factor